MQGMLLNLRLQSAVLALACALPAAAQDSFYLRNGDRVVFYGDSITDQRLYTTFVETFVVTRFPERNISFVHSGWGGDRVGGGGGGPIDVRLQRDVLAYKPTVVTIMLGMNDGGFRAHDASLFEKYSAGFTHIVQQLRKELPEIRITAIRPSPFDEVTRGAIKGGGYNPVLVRYGDFVQLLAGKEKFDVADFNAPVVRMLEKAKAENSALAQKIIPDRVHPAASGHLIMASALLRAWNAPSLVSAVEIDAAAKTVTHATYADVSDFKAAEDLSWTQLDSALPMPMDLKDEATSLALRATDFVAALNRQQLKITGLAEGQWTLRIDGQEVANFSQRHWAEGVNLAMLPTPMAKQAAWVHALTLKHNDIHYARWRSVQTPLEQDKLETTAAAMQALDALEAEIVARQRATAKPVPHQFDIVRAGVSRSK